MLPEDREGPAARVVPVEDRVARVVPEEDPVARAVPMEDRVARAVPEEDPVAQAARVVGVAQEVPEVDRVDPAGTNDPAVGSCRIKVQMLPDDFGRILSGVSGLLNVERPTLTNS